MEKALKYELETQIPELTPTIDAGGNETAHVWPTNAPESAERPYLVYARINTDTVKTLSGYTEKQALSYMVSIMAFRYADMYNIRDKVENMLLSFPQTNIGSDNSIYVEDIQINNITETWEPELKVNRGIIDFTIYY